MPRVTLSFKGKKISATPVTQEEVVVGRDGNCTIQVDSLAIAPKHLKIYRHRKSYIVTALNDEFPLFLNNDKIENAALKDGDQLQVGKHSLEFIDDAVGSVASPSIFQNVAALEQNEKILDKPSETNLSGILQILSGSNIGRIIPLNQPLVKIGKSGKECAVIAHRESGYHLSFLEGENPPKVNKKPVVDQSYHLRDGDQIEFGDTSMYFQEGTL
jgi:pSer/pThr/pTyr-binding forkhead associated (FHA) protein